MNRRYRKTFHGLALLGCVLVVFRIGVTFLSSNVEERRRSVKLQDAGVHQGEKALRNLLGAPENGISEPTQRASVVRKAVDSKEDPFPDLTENPPPSQRAKDGFSDGINKAKPWLFGITALLCILMMTGAHYCGDKVLNKATDMGTKLVHKSGDF
ncbi:hypothetical protein AOXY_G29426 [Acipenser oxyrinchus oxyrinchus]|uniref:Uncharacterized protein n=1 Tax=Acipenser oxyrinchus oxyrinchus TaxID=40147 RepID=A0AAD8CP32_ACIOX|nr:hypothetical protein AOXY_G29426 [Acipenser oxyrinchus oxyrinchus]